MPSVSARRPPPNKNKRTPSRCLTCEDAWERIREDEGVLARVRRVLWWRRMLRPGEVSGSLGDLGKFLDDESWQRPASR